MIWWLVPYFLGNIFLGVTHFRNGVRAKRQPLSLVLVFIFNIFFALPFNAYLFHLEVKRLFKEQRKYHQ